MWSCVWKIERFLTAVLMYPANLLQIWIEEDYTSKWAVMNGRLIRFIDPSVPFCKIYPRRYCDILISRPWIFIFIFICIFAFCLFCWGRVGGGGGCDLRNNNHFFSKMLFGAVLSPPCLPLLRTSSSPLPPPPPQQHWWECNRQSKQKFSCSSALHDPAG